MGSQGHDAQKVRATARVEFTRLAPTWGLSPEQDLDPLWPPHERALALSQLTSGLRVLDLGCGAGHPTLVMAERVGAEGAVVGLDITPALLAGAQAWAKLRNLRHVEFRLIASELELGIAEASVDRCTCLFSLMYMPDPLAALRQAHCALRPGGRLVVSGWAALDRCPWWAVPSAIVERSLGHPLFDPAAPGPFALGSPAALGELLAAAGFTAIETSAMEIAREADTPEDYWQWLARAGPLAGMALDPNSDQWQSIHSDLVQTLSEQFLNGKVRLSGEVLFAAGDTPRDGVSRGD